MRPLILLAVLASCGGPDPDLDAGLDAPASDVPAVDVPRSDAPSADAPSADVPLADVPPADVPRDAPSLDAPPADADGGPSCVASPPAVATPGLFVGTPSMPMAGPAGYACLGARTAPAGGAAFPYLLELRGFGSRDTVGMARVWFFRDNVITETCGASCQEVMTDAMGDAAVTGSVGAWYAYRVFPRAGPTMATSFVDTVHVNQPAPLSGPAEATAVAHSTLNLIPAAYGVLRVPGSAIVLGQIEDCALRRVRGGVVRLFGADGCEIVPGPGLTDPHIQYFDGMENPDGSTTFSQVDGLYTAFNLPAPASGYAAIRVEAWGRRTAGAPLERIGCEVVQVLADGVSLTNIGPLRSDYPVGHACAE